MRRLPTWLLAVAGIGFSGAAFRYGLLALEALTLDMRVFALYLAAVSLASTWGAVRLFAAIDTPPPATRRRLVGATLLAVVAVATVTAASTHDDPEPLVEIETTTTTTSSKPPVTTTTAAWPPPDPAPWAITALHECVDGGVRVHGVTPAGTVLHAGTTTVELPGGPYDVVVPAVAVVRISGGDTRFHPDGVTIDTADCLPEPEQPTINVIPDGWHDAGAGVILPDEEGG